MYPPLLSTLSDASTSPIALPLPLLNTLVSPLACHFCCDCDCHFNRIASVSPSCVLLTLPLPLVRVAPDFVSDTCHSRYAFRLSRLVHRLEAQPTTGLTRFMKQIITTAIIEEADTTFPSLFESQEACDDTHQPSPSTFIFSPYPNSHA